MSEYRLVSEPQADLDIEAVFGWYEKEQPGVGCAFLLNRWLGWPWGVRYSESERSFALTGSWFPVTLMLCIFILRYFANVSLALNLGFTRSELFSSALAWVYGLLGGIFLSGSVRLWRLAHPRKEIVV